MILERCLKYLAGTDNDDQHCLNVVDCTAFNVIVIQTLVDSDYSNYLSNKHLVSISGGEASTLNDEM